MKLRSVLVRSLSTPEVIDIYPLASEKRESVTRYLPIAFPDSRSVNIWFRTGKGVKGLYDSV